VHSILRIKIAELPKEYIFGEYGFFVINVREESHHGVKTSKYYLSFIVFSFWYDALNQLVKRFLYSLPYVNPLIFVSLASFFIISSTSFISSVYAGDEFAGEYRAYQTHAREGKAAFHKKNYQTAIIHYSRAIELSPFEVDSYYKRGIALYKSGKEQEAIEDFNKVLTMDSRSISSYVYRGLCREKIGEYVEALKDYTSALSINPKDANIHNNLAWLYATAMDEKVQDKVKALEHAKKAAELSNEKKADILDTLARAYLMNEMNKEAIEAEKKALKIEPNNKRFQKNLRVYEEGGGGVRSKE
jgi:tetratricopeptide (TPR) repeat protein